MSAGNTVITAKYVNAPKPGKKYGSVKDETDKYWEIDPSKVQLTQGGTYAIEYSTRDWQGKTYFTIQGAVASAPSVAQAAAPAVARVTNGHATSDDARMVPAHVSNFVAHAIQAGRIKTPEEMIIWAQWAYQAGLSMKEKPARYPERGDAWESDDLPEMRG